MVTAVDDKVDAIALDQGIPVFLLFISQFFHRAAACASGREQPLRWIKSSLSRVFRYS